MINQVVSFDGCCSKVSMCPSSSCPILASSGSPSAGASVPPLGLIGQGLQSSEIAFKLILPLAIANFLLQASVTPAPKRAAILLGFCKEMSWQKPTLFF